MNNYQWIWTIATLLFLFFPSDRALAHSGHSHEPRSHPSPTTEVQTEPQVTPFPSPKVPEEVVPLESVNLSQQPATANAIARTGEGIFILLIVAPFAMMGMKQHFHRSSR